MRFLQCSLLGVFLVLFSGPCLPEDDYSKNISIRESHLKGEWIGGVGLTGASKIVEFILDLPGESAKECTVEIKIGEQYIPGAKFSISGFAHYYPGMFTSGGGIDLVVLNCFVNSVDQINKVASIFNMVELISKMDVVEAQQKAISTDSSQGTTKKVLTPQSIVNKFIEAAIREKERVAQICEFLKVAKTKQDAKFFFSIPIRIHKLAMVNMGGRRSEKAELILQPILFTPLENSVSEKQQERSQFFADLIKDVGANPDSYDIWESGLDKEKSNADGLKGKSLEYQDHWKQLGWYAAVSENLDLDASKVATQYYEGIRTAKNYWLYLGIAKSKGNLMMIEVKKNE